MNRTVRNAGLIALAAAALYYPAMRLYRYAARRRRPEAETDSQHQGKGAFAHHYRGNHKPHHRKAHSNGHEASVHQQ